MQSVEGSEAAKSFRSSLIGIAAQRAEAGDSDGGDTSHVTRPFLKTQGDSPTVIKTSCTCSSTVIPRL